MESLFEYLISKENKKKITFSKNPIKFNDLKFGMKGINFFGEEGTVVGFGTAKEIGKKDFFSTIHDDLKEGLIEPDTPCVIVIIQGEMAAYVYGPSGFVCYK